MEYITRGGGGGGGGQGPMELPPAPTPSAPPPSPAMPPDLPKQGGGGKAVFALILALGACAGMAFVYLEPIMAYESLKRGTYSFGRDETQWLMRGRMREAGIPLIASSAGALLAFMLAMASKHKGAGKLALFLSLAALGVAGYVWALYADQIIRAL